MADRPRPMRDSSSRDEPPRISGGMRKSFAKRVARDAADGEKTSTSNMRKPQAPHVVITRRQLLHARLDQRQRTNCRRALGGAAAPRTTERMADEVCVAPRAGRQPTAPFRLGVVRTSRRRTASVARPIRH